MKIKINDKVLRVAELVFMLLFMTVGFMQYSSLTFGSSFISIVQWPTVALGALLTLYRVIHFKRYISTRGIWLLIAFAASFMLTAVMNYHYNFYDNVRAFIFMVFEFGILFATDCSESSESVYRKAQVCSVYFVSVMSALSLVSFILMFAGCNQQIKTGDNPAYYIGFNFGRLWGAFWDPNIAAAMATITIVLSIGFAIKYKSWRRMLCVLSIILQSGYIVFSDSRTGRVSLVVGITLYFLLYAIRREKPLFRLKRVASVIVATAVAFCVALAIPSVVSMSYNGVVTVVNTINSNSSQTGDKKPTMLSQIGRTDSVSSADVSNRRFDIWGSAVQLYKSSPVYGVSHFGILSYTADNVPDAYIINNDEMKFGTMHNVLFDVLASQGTLGIVIFAACGVWFVVFIVRRRKKLEIPGHKDFNIAMFTCVAVTACSSMFMTELVYVITPLTLMFWIELGCLCHFASRKDEPNE